MYRRIVAVVSACALAMVAIASFFAVRLAMQEEQGEIRDDLRQAAQYAAQCVGQEELSKIGRLFGARITHMAGNGEILFDTSGQVGFYLD